MLGSPWWVVVGSTLGLTVANGPVVFFTFGLFLGPVTSEFGWDRATFSSSLLAGEGADELFGGYTWFRSHVQQLRRRRWFARLPRRLAGFLARNFAPFALAEENNLEKYLKELDALEEPDNKSGLTNEEKVLMKILKQFH